MAWLAACSKSVNNPTAKARGIRAKNFDECQPYTYSTKAVKTCGTIVNKITGTNAPTIDPANICAAL